MSFKRYFHNTAVLLLLSSAVSADKSVDEVFNVRMTGDSNCAKYHSGNNDIITKMFDDMQKIVKDTNEVISADYETGWDDKTRGLAKSFFGLQGDDGKKPDASTIDGQILSQVQCK